MEFTDTGPSPSVVADPIHPPTYALLELELRECDDPNITYETLVLRLIKRVCLEFGIPFTHMLETIRQGPCVMDRQMHPRLRHLWNRRKRPVTLDEQHCVERVLGHDYNRVGDMMKLASILNKISDPADLFHFFAMDGFLGDDPKRYVDAFRYGPEDVQYKHVRAVRVLYEKEKIENPSVMRMVLESIFDDKECVDPSWIHAKDWYVGVVGSWNVVKEIAEWRREQEEKSKKKRSVEDDRAAKLIKTED